MTALVSVRSPPVKILSTPLASQHVAFLEREQGWLAEKLRLGSYADGGYKVNRTLHDIKEQLSLKVNLLELIANIYGKQKRVVEVLEGGCGEGVTLLQIKAAFADKVRATGITLSSKNVEAALRNMQRPKIDELIIGPLERHEFDRQYDFILDVFGPNYYFGIIYDPNCPIISTYGRILAKGGEALIKFQTADAERVVNTHKRVFAKNQLAILDYRSGIEDSDFLLRSTK